ncbi:hypothetical protein CVT25_008901, partial [Psilocybe cyanescens]
MPFFLDDNKLGTIGAPEPIVLNRRETRFLTPFIPAGSSSVAGLIMDFTEAKTCYTEQHVAGEVVVTPDSALHLPSGAVPIAVDTPQILTRAALIRAHTCQAARNNTGPSSQSRRPSSATTRIIRNRPRPAAIDVRGVQYTIGDDSDWEPPESISSASQPQKLAPKNSAISSICTPAIFPLFNPNHPHFQVSLPDETLGIEDNSSPLRRSKRIALQVVDRAPDNNPVPSTSTSHSSRLSSSPTRDSFSSRSS